MRTVYIIILISLFSCVKEEEPRGKVIERELQAKVVKYKKKKAKKCQREMMEDISIEVDSIMYFLVAQMNGETDIMPARPNRPSRLVDTIKLNELKNDPFDK